MGHRFVAPVLAVGAALVLVSGCGTLLSLGEEDDDAEDVGAPDSGARTTDSSSPDALEDAVPADARTEADVDAGPIQWPGRLIFVTSAAGPATRGGVLGANGDCQAAATAAGLPGRFEAYLAAGGVSARLRFLDAGGPVVRRDGTVAFASAIDNAPLVPVNVTENNTVLAAGERAWIGGTTFAPSNQTCGDWTTGASADSVFVDSVNWDQISNVSCNGQLHLFCVEVD